MVMSDRKWAEAVHFLMSLGNFVSYDIRSVLRKVCKPLKTEKPGELKWLDHFDLERKERVMHWRDADE